MPNSLPTRLNPFENQVYFYIPSDSADISYCCCLNPFENQVYFYLVNTGYYHNLDFLS